MVVGTIRDAAAGLRPVRCIQNPVRAPQLGKWLFIGVLLQLTACSSMPPTSQVLAAMGNQEVVAPTGDVRAESISTLPPGPDGATSILDSSSPVLVADGYRTYYRAFRISPTSGQIKIVVHAYCYCLGFDKRVMVPALQLLTETGERVLPTDTRYSLVQPEGFTPLSLKLRVIVPSARIRYVIVTADNSNPDSVVQGLQFSSGFNLDIRSYPLGKFNLTYESM